MMKSKMLPFLPEEKSNHACFWSLTKKDGVFSLLHEFHALAHDFRHRKPRFELVEELGRETHEVRTWVLAVLAESGCPIIGLRMQTFRGENRNPDGQQTFGALS
jgi:hypothetical protein